MKKADAIQRMTLSLLDHDPRTATRLMIETRGITQLDYRRCAQRAERIRVLLAQGVTPFDALKQTGDR